MKKCTKCGINKLIESFYKDKGRKDGLATSCKACRREYFLKYIKTSEKWKVLNRKKVAKYKIDNPEKVKARNKARKQANKIKKGKCENCEITEKLQMHHPSYEKPLEVITLCHGCHMNIHYRKPLAATQSLLISL